jgi:p-aminobenzoyl-glutamate transporter AbgT
MNWLGLGNLFSVQAFWPFLAAQVWLFAAACYFFTRLLISPGGEDGNSRHA